MKRPRTRWCLRTPRPERRAVRDPAASWHSRRWRPVQAALLDLLLLPPPATGTGALPRAHRPGAGRAADRPVATVIELVICETAGPDVVPDLLFRPADERCDLGDASVPAVRRDHRRRGPRG